MLLLCRFFILSTCLILFHSISFSSSALQEEPVKQIDFHKQILPILKTKCLACHGENSPQSGLRLTTIENILKGGDSGFVVVWGSSQESPLFQAIHSGSMPLDGNQLSDSQIHLIGQWIDQKTSISDQVSRPEEKITEIDVMPSILHRRCAACHGRRKQEGGFDVRTRTSLLKGGISGPAIVQGNPEKSLLLQRIISGEMPPPESQAAYTIRPVTTEELMRIRRWIASGAPEDSPERMATENNANSLIPDKNRDFWSFQPPKRPLPPRVLDESLVYNPVDSFLLKELESVGMSFSPQSNPEVLIRRAYLDLVGLPPSPEDVETFLKLTNPMAYERLIDRLLSSPRYGERWSRYWLDATGYSDSEGIIDADLIRPHAYRYRDYVIRSLNSDKPYDQFLLEQIAGDELFDYKTTNNLSPKQIDHLLATGFLRMGPDGTHEYSNNSIAERFDVLANQVEIFSSAVMGLTVACAQCHNHKYDPISQQDYYRFSAIFQSAYDPYDWFVPNIRDVPTNKDGAYPQRSLAMVPKEEILQVKAHNDPIRKRIQLLKNQLGDKEKSFRKLLFQEKLDKLPKGVSKDVDKAFKLKAKERNTVQQYLVEKFKEILKVEKKELEERFEDYQSEAAKIQETIKTAQKQVKRIPAIRALFDMGGEPTPTYILKRGQALSPELPVQPGVLSVLSNGIRPYQVNKPDWTTDTSGRRLALAQWLIQPNHPLTARVIVNRIWQHHFGRGLVSTPGNFGLTGDKPSHPELLDWLATELVRHNWSLKAIHKLIMTSSAYRQRSRFNPNSHSADLENILLSRFPMRRLEADVIRDSILKVAQRLNSTPFGPADQVKVQAGGEVVSECLSGGCRRSIYMLQRRSMILTMLQTFDAPQLNPNCLKRSQSTVSSQALQLWNSKMVRENSQYFAGRIMDKVYQDVEKQVYQVYLTALSRPPSLLETRQGIKEIRSLTEHWMEKLEQESLAEPKRTKAQWLALTTFCHAILNSAEFIYID